MTVALRAMTEADVPAVMELERATFPEDAWSESMLRDELRHQPHTRHYVVAEDDSGEIIGYAGLAAAGDQGDVQTIAVRADRQGRGVGRALLGELLAEAERRGCREVFLEVRVDNDRAQALYERFGFERIGVRKRYYQPSGTDAIVMRRRRGGAGAHPVGFAK
ncbi:MULTISPECIES: ribosomal protein S18-alanine N-acetyltransferase [Thermomonospora]|uniref:Ribosomal-protein-alanine acetyltransferase n=1 Tax=Thermomonospora curvata (strain ATCC 19995 / DSM 43183 / JCM 3096 / KCTC 9072 / NBRC 15933 / NCIMB 10081 / Henssen B9) TaxID=471852 RepID=D1A319_THECD|nr:MULTISPECIES: ribosomal protein S18-alanine N-acetyltransferase [Thermomonospora]ACY99789.1 ribosomal-protein-alanine acetyltransferase [Thermomonospora curvata DSM 43183]PKK12795.1 MAG: ribosomal-protein-alanine N-acetyltransferase [Thermomonospora sp. CIF 1]